MSELVQRRMMVLLTSACFAICFRTSAQAQGVPVQVIRLEGSHDATGVSGTNVDPLLRSTVNASLNNAAGSSNTAAGSSNNNSGSSNSASVSSSSPASSNNPSASGASNQSTPEHRVLVSGANVVHLELGHVRDILLDVRRAKEAATHLYGEVTRHPITSYNYVDAMGPVMMEIPMPTFDMSEVLPARQQWVQLYMNEITPAVAYVKADLDGIKSGESDLNLTARDKVAFDNDLQECSDSINKAVAVGDALKQLTIAPPYDNLGIAKQTSDLHKELKEVEKTTRRMIGQVKKARQ